MNTQRHKRIHNTAGPSWSYLGFPSKSYCFAHESPRFSPPLDSLLFRKRRLTFGLIFVVLFPRLLFFFVTNSYPNQHKLCGSIVDCKFGCFLLVWLSIKVSDLTDPQAVRSRYEGKTTMPAPPSHMEFLSVRSHEPAGADSRRKKRGSCFWFQDNYLVVLGLGAVVAHLQLTAQDGVPVATLLTGAEH